MELGQQLDDRPAPDAAPSRPWTVVTGVIGADTHIVGNRIISLALEAAGFHVVSLGALTPAEEFVQAAIETAADAILVSSLYGQGELDARDLRAACVEAGLEDILLYIGGNLVVGKQDWAPVEQRFRAMGFDRVYPPGTRPNDFIPQLRLDLEARDRHHRR
jgi:methylaspartate mutase sigma subunit